MARGDPLSRADRPGPPGHFGVLVPKHHGARPHASPESQAALAQVHEDAEGRHTAHRFELYIAGVELANGYDELVDAAEQRARFQQANHARVASGRPALPIDEDLLKALDSGLPPPPASRWASTGW